MKNLLIPISLLLIITAIGCNKNNNSYSTTDHTAGMITQRSWSGYTSGYFQGDTVINTRDTLWALYFNRVISDTLFTVQKINGFEISVLGTPLDYLLTDSLTNQLVKFDTILSGADTSFLTYYYLRDSMTYVFHNLTGFNSAAGQYYQVNEFLHTN